MLFDIELVCEKIEIEEFGNSKRVKLKSVDLDDLVDSVKATVFGNRSCYESECFDEQFRKMLDRTFEWD